MLKIVAVSFLILVAFSSRFITINISASMPPGIYIRHFSAWNRGDIVEACLNKKFQLIGLQQHYLKPGFCRFGATKIIKKIIAVPGDNVELANNYLNINDQNYVFPTFFHDQNGKPLLFYPRGIYHNTGGYWLIGTNDQNSWDSRYWGPLENQQIIAKLTAFIIF